MGASQPGAAVWEGPVIPFEIDPHFSNPARILQAIRDHWEEQTNIRFVRRAGQGHYVLFRHGQECQSPAEPQSGMHPVTCTPDASVAAIIHEIGHALGCVHAHQRSDRDNVVDVQEANIRRGKAGNFRRIVNSINYTTVTRDEEIDHAGD